MGACKKIFTGICSDILTYRPSVDFIIKDTDIQGNRKMEEKAKERDNKLLLTLIGWLVKS